MISYRLSMGRSEKKKIFHDYMKSEISVTSHMVLEMGKDKELI